MTENAPDQSVSVIIVTFNGREWIGKCIRSLTQSSKHCSIIVVDNCSTDGTVDYVNDEFPDVKLIVMKENRGFGQANNIGIECALAEQSEFVFLLNQDAKLDENCIEQLLFAADQHPSAGIISPIHYSYDGTEIDFGFAWYLKESNCSFQGDLRKGREAPFYKVKSVPAALWFVRSQALREAGGFDPIFFLYGEDDDLAGRITRKGWEVILATAAKGYHYHSRHDSPREFRFRKQRSYFSDSIRILKNADVSLIRRVSRLLVVILRGFTTAVTRKEYEFLSCMAKGRLTALVCLPKVMRSMKEQEYANSPFLDL